jgi:hypothetical protein
MIYDSVELFDDMPAFGFKLFDVVLLVPSSSNAVKRISEAIEPRLNSDALILVNAFNKTRIRNVKLIQSQLDKEPSKKTTQRVNECYTKFRYKHYDKVTRMHYIPTRFRRYFTNFFTWKKDAWISKMYKKNVLVVDDTFGEGVSLREIMWMLETDVKPNLACGFAVMKDCE